METEGKRLNKYIADAGYCSRREADRLIEAGAVEIRRRNRKDEELKPVEKASVGDRVYRGDTVYVRGRELPKKEPERVYYLYHKPRGIVCTADRSVEGNIMDAEDIPQGITYAGRLDKDSSGLLILTNDGELIDRMMRASSQHEKEYLCTVDKPVTGEFLAAMGNGVKICLDDDAHRRKNPNGVYVTTRPCKVRRAGERKFTIVLTQGYNRQIRRMCKALGYSVTALTRTRILSFTLGSMKPGAVIALKGPEIRKLRDEVFEETGGEVSHRTKQNAKRGEWRKRRS